MNLSWNNLLPLVSVLVANSLQRISRPVEPYCSRITHLNRCSSGVSERLHFLCCIDCIRCHRPCLMVGGCRDPPQPLLRQRTIPSSPAQSLPRLSRLWGGN